MKKKKSFTLIGMSNSGKSFWRQRAQEAGFEPFCCDDRIEERLGPFLQSRGFKGIEDVARWMGQPYEPQSPANQALYLKEEEGVMLEAIKALRTGSKPRVIDTTGSVIYLDRSIFEALQEFTVIVLLDVPKSHLKEMYRQYLKKPKPVIWGDVFTQRAGESPQDSLERCYPTLLRTRGGMYHQWAHVSLTYKERRAPGFGINEFLQRIGIERP